MSTRILSGRCRTSDGTLAFHRADRYGHDLGEPPVTGTVALEEYAVELPVNDDTDSWIVEDDGHRLQLWAYAGEGTQICNLVTPIYPPRRLEVLLRADDATLGANVARVFERTICGDPIVSEEYERALCRFGGFADVGGDADMCRINKAI